MWHEARRQEKKIRGLMVDYKKRAERRREFYEKIKADPAQFVRAYGRPCKINLDPAIAIAAEGPQSMMPWQGNSDNMIDRFDVRAHLDILPEERSYKRHLTEAEEDEERKANYERYRILVENECAGLTEEQALHQLYLDEQFGAINKDSEEEKNKLKDKKAAIGFTYEDSTPGDKTEKKGGDDDDSDDSDEESDEDVETVDLDITLDVDTLTVDQMVQLNQCGVQFGMGEDDYVRLLRRDKDEQEALRQAKLLEEEKAQFAGRKSRRERRAYKEKKLAGRALSPPSYAARDSPKYEPYKRSPSRSRSRSRSPSPKRKKAKKLYITSFGGNESDSDTAPEGPVQGPVLPPGMGPSVKESSETSSENKPAVSWRSERLEKLRRQNRSSSADSPPTTGKRFSKTRSRSRSRSRGKRSRDRYSRERSGQRRSWSRRSRDKRSRSRDRRSHDRSRDRRDRSWRKSRSRSKSRSRRRFSSSRSRSRSSRSSSRSTSRSRSSKSSSRSRSRSRDRHPIRRYRRESLSSKSSDSEDDKRSSYRQSRDSSSYSKYKSLSTKSSSSTPIGKSSSQSQARLTAREKLQKKMQMALAKTLKADKKAYQIKQEKLDQEKMDREEEIRQRTLEMRRREREKRHRELEEGYASHHSDDSSDNSDSARRDSPRRKDKDRADSVKKREKDKSSESERKGSKEDDRRKSKGGKEDSNAGRGREDSQRRERDDPQRRERVGNGHRREEPPRPPPRPPARQERRYSSSSRSRSRSGSPKIKLVSY